MLHLNRKAEIQIVLSADPMLFGGRIDALRFSPIAETETVAQNMLVRYITRHLQESC